MIFYPHHFKTKPVYDSEGIVLIMSLSPRREEIKNFNYITLLIAGRGEEEAVGERKWDEERNRGGFNFMRV